MRNIDEAGRHQLLQPGVQVRCSFVAALARLGRALLAYNEALKEVHEHPDFPAEMAQPEVPK